MGDNPIGYQSLLKYVLDELEVELRQRISQREIAEKAGISTTTLSRWMRHYEIMGQLDVATLYAITEAVNVYAGKVGKRYEPMQLIQFVGWHSSNKIEGLLALGA